MKVSLRYKLVLLICSCALSTACQIGFNPPEENASSALQSVTLGTSPAPTPSATPIPTATATPTPTPTPAPSPQAIIRVAPGQTSDITDSKGHVWSADFGADGGTMAIESGGMNLALIKSFPVTVTNGQIQIKFAMGAANVGKIDVIEIY